MNKDVNLKLLANQLMFDFTEVEIEKLDKEFKVFLEQVELLNKIDTTNVIPMIRPFEEFTSYLREDEINDVITVEEVLANAPKHTNGYFVVPKVVK